MLFGCKKASDFSSCKTNRQRKAFFQHGKISISHRIQTNAQPQISSAKTYCELAAKQPFFETSQSCVCCIASLSHRFKSSPAIPGSLAVLDTAGYMMNAGHFRRNLESSGDLNRPRESRGSQPFGVLLVLFVQAKRIKPFPLPGASRFCKP